MEARFSQGDLAEWLRITWVRRSGIRQAPDPAQIIAREVESTPGPRTTDRITVPRRVDVVAKSPEKPVPKFALGDRCGIH